MAPLSSKNKNTIIILGALWATMLGLSFASVPLYRIFCQRTGYGGTPKIALEESKTKTSRKITVRFNADVNRGFPWKFHPLQAEQTLYIGENGLAFYQFQNLSSTPLIGIATYNVTPDKAAPYFNKVECFCFDFQKLEGGEMLEMPVQYYIDPAFNEDPNLKDVHTITLSYTFFHAKDPKINQILGLPTMMRNK